jgi:hypothetical protein
LIALSHDNDPFYANLPMRSLRAHWFKKIWDRLGFKRGTHLRRVHYKLIKSGTVKLPRVVSWTDKETGRHVETSVYLNNKHCWNFLRGASADARYLNLVPIDHIVDRRNAETVLNYAPNASSAWLATLGETLSLSFDLNLNVSVPDFPNPPRLYANAPSVAQPVAIEIWIEKSGMDHVLAPLAERWGANYTSGTGDISITRCNDLIKRSREHGKPVRVLVISDFDPGGDNMPIGLARKLEFLIRNTAPDLYVQVRPIALTLEQVRRYQLPRNAIKESDRKAAAFERRYGAGATELDALEESDLREIVEKEIKRYVDPDLDANIRAVRNEVQTELSKINKAVERKHTPDLRQLLQEHKVLAEQAEVFIDQFRERFEARFRRQFDDLAERTESLFHEILDARAPDPDAIDWSEPEPPDEDEDPLFDSTRDYVAQIDRFKEHQQKPTERRPRRNGGRSA